MRTELKTMLPAVVSGLLLTSTFPKINLDWLAWVALVPLLWSLLELGGGIGTFATQYAVGENVVLPPDGTATAVRAPYRTTRSPARVNEAASGWLAKL